MNNETKRYERGERIRFQPRDCPLCGKHHDPVVLDANKFYAWKIELESIQNVFPEMSNAEREILISGTCPGCFKELFSRCEKEDLVLESCDKSTFESEVDVRNRRDKMSGALEIQRVRDRQKEEEHELEQRAKDEAAVDAEEEAQRQKDFEDWMESIEEWNSFYSTDPLCPGNGI